MLVAQQESLGAVGAWALMLGVGLMLFGSGAVIVGIAHRMIGLGAGVSVSRVAYGAILGHRGLLEVQLQERNLHPRWSAAIQHPVLGQCQLCHDNSAANSERDRSTAKSEPSSSTSVSWAHVTA